MWREFMIGRNIYQCLLVKRNHLSVFDQQWSSCFELVALNVKDYDQRTNET